MKRFSVLAAFVLLVQPVGFLSAEEERTVEMTGALKQLGLNAAMRCERLELSKEECAERYGGALDPSRGIPITSIMELVMVGGGDEVSTQDIHNGKSCPSPSATMYESVDYSCTAVSVPGHGSQQLCCQAGCNYVCQEGEDGSRTWQSSWSTCDVDLNRCSILGPSDKFPGGDPLDWLWP